MPKQPRLVTGFVVDNRLPRGKTRCRDVHTMSFTLAWTFISFRGMGLDCGAGMATRPTAGSARMFTNGRGTWGSVNSTVAVVTP